TFASLTLLCIIFTRQMKLRHVTTIVIFAVYLICLAYFSSQIRQSLQRISCCLAKRRFSRRMATQSLTRRLYSIGLYDEHFGFQVFSLFRMDNAFILTLTLFIVNYTVLISQTANL